MGVRLGGTVVPGGPRRQESVAAGVREADADLVLVHDGARPLVSPALVDAVIEATAASVRRSRAWPCTRP